MYSPKAGIPIGTLINQWIANALGRMDSLQDS